MPTIKGTDADTTGTLVTHGDVTIDGSVDVTGPMNSQGGMVTLTFRSPVFDMATATSGTVQAIPSIPGYHPETVLQVAYATSGAGTCTTGVTLNSGNNANEDNIGSSVTIAVAAINAAIAAGFPCRLGALSVASGTGARRLIDLTAPVTVEITTPASGTGGFALSGYIVSTVTLRPL